MQSVCNQLILKSIYQLHTDLISDSYCLPTYINVFETDLLPIVLIINYLRLFAVCAVTVLFPFS